MTRHIATKWLLLGESPNVATQRHPKLWLRPDSSGIRHSANRLLEYSGYDQETFLATFTRDNLIHRLPRRSGRGRNFPIETAKREVPRVFEQHALAHGFVVLGKRVPRAFRWYSMGDTFGPVPLSHLEYLKWYWVMSAHGVRKMAVIVPHPSGLNRWWNVPGNLEKAKNFFADLQDGVSFKVERPLQEIAS